ncbi:hypothetical protein KSD_41510 [Ktedonobacter sp. SOSP1-85]|nr:hypothetical protein KSD_41510 [Ktedonobacter sp. SOSP1-85]
MVGNARLEEPAFPEKPEASHLSVSKVYGPLQYQPMSLAAKTEELILKNLFPHDDEYVPNGSGAK